MMLFRYVAILAIAASAFAVQVAAQAPAPAQTRLSVSTRSGLHDFSVEVMRSREELEKGLMYRRQMASDKGMLFDFGTPQEVSMWMKNTYLPLDMLFIGQNGAIVSIKENAVPMSEDIISSHGQITGVLEINAGTVKRIAAHPGDVVHHPMFGS